jgi:hypothetical protein
MKDLIEALQIFLKYADKYAPTHCEHDVLTIGHIDPDDVSQADRMRLEELGFHVGDPHGGGDECFYSFRFGSC